MPREQEPRALSAAFAPGRVNLIGEHTDYNDGLALPFAIREGVRVHARRLPRGLPLNPTRARTRAWQQSSESSGTTQHPDERVLARAEDLGECDEFPLDDPTPVQGWRAFVRGMVAELRAAGFPLVGARVDIAGEVPLGSGLSSSAALEVALCLALVELAADADGPPGTWMRSTDRRELARLCARVEHDWAGAQTGLLDQLASLYGEPEHALCIDFRTLAIDPVPLRLEGWRLEVLDSGERHVHASSGYNRRREECAQACELLGIASLRDADPWAAEHLAQPLARRVRHVLTENERVRDAVEALQARDMNALGALLNASHASLRDDYEVSTPAVDATVDRLLAAGAAGARIMGGGFGGSVLALFPPHVSPPDGAREVRPGPGARLLDA